MYDYDGMMGLLEASISVSGGITIPIERFSFFRSVFELRFVKSPTRIYEPKIEE